MLSMPCSLFGILLILLACWTGFSGGNDCHAVDLQVYNRPLYNAFDQCGQKGYAMDCSRAGLSEIPITYPRPSSRLKPPMCLLDLSYNNIRIVRSYSFLNVLSVKFLNLSQTNLSVIEEGAFTGLTNLTYLSLSSNNLQIDDKQKGIGKGAFKPLKNLIWIDLSANPIKSYKGLDKELRYLSSLQVLIVYGCDGCKFGPNIKELSKLRILFFSAAQDNLCVFKNISEDMFEHFKSLNISAVYLSHCGIQNVSKLAFRPFKNSLEILDASYNERLSFSGMDDILSGLKFSNKLKSIDVARIHPPHGRGTALQLSHVTSLLTMKGIQSLKMDLNKLEVIDESFLCGKSLPTTFCDVSLAGNRLVYGDYTRCIYHISILQTLDISRQHLYYDPFFTENGIKSSQCNCSSPSTIESCNRVFLPKGLQHLLWTESFLDLEIQQILVCNGIDLKNVNISYNKLHALHGPVDGVINVDSLDLSHNHCRNISDHFFEGFPSLLKLNLSTNKLGYLLASGRANPFRSLSGLEYLKLDRNKIFCLSSYIFDNLTSLKYLDLKDNNLDTCKANLRKLDCLRKLDLSNNKYDTVPESLQNELEILSSSQCNKHNDVWLIMSGNPLQCTCYSVPFMKWVLQSRVCVDLTKAECHLPNDKRVKLKSQEDFTRLLKKLEKECVDYHWVMFTVSFLIILVLVAVLTKLLHRKRWKIYHWYYKRRRRRNVNGYRRIFNFDAFVSYSEDMSSFVKNKLIPTLEDERGLKLWVDDRDSHPGASVAANIAHAINNSKRSVHVIDKQYMVDEWCIYEINMAHMEGTNCKRKMIIVVLMDVDAADIRLDLMRLLHFEQYLSYPMGDNAAELDAFWTQLFEIITLEND